MSDEPESQMMKDFRELQRQFAQIPHDAFTKDASPDRKYRRNYKQPQVVSEDTAALVEADRQAKATKREARRRKGLTA